MTLLDNQRDAWLLAFDAPRHISQQEIIARCDKIEALFPDLAAWDPAGRGKNARPCHWLLDLIQCAGLAEEGENEQGYPARGSWAQSRFYVGMAAELSCRAVPGDLLMIDRHTQIPRA